MKEKGIETSFYSTFDLGDIPYICLRLPTGGGKTVLASYAIREAAFNYMNISNPLVMWLVPTITIAEQTLSCLNQPKHPYRQAIDEYFGGRVSVFRIADVSNIRPQDFVDKVCIVIGTLAALRVQDKTGRRIYDHNENYQDHFERFKPNTETLDRIEEGPDKGKIKYSFVNLCHIHKPLVIMDEAHNARTVLSFETLKRLNPSCVIELTATPNISRANGSNVLHSVSALELKHEDMIKLPIMLKEHDIWEQAISEAILTRKRLSLLAQKETDYVRPIILYQAESKDKTVTVDVLKNYLVDNESIAEDTIAIATGDIKELKDINLFSPECKIEHIITVEALKEGWDCSFAYVFCSVANVKSSTAVEQLLGRVLRMPYARSRSLQDLNMAYAHVVSPSFSSAAQDLKDALVNKMGFEKLEVDAYVKSLSKPESALQIDLFDREEDTVVVGGFDSQALDDDIRSKVLILEHEGKTELRLNEYVSDAELESIIEAVDDNNKTEIKQKLNKQRIARSLDHEEKNQTKSGFKVPRIVFIDDNEEIDLLEDNSFLDAADWNILDYSHELKHFNINKSGNTFEIDINEKNKVVWGVEDSLLSNQEAEIKLPDLDEIDLVHWLDKEIRRPDIPQTQNYLYIHKALEFLIRQRCISLEQLFMAKFQLALALKNLIRDNVNLAKEKGYQSLVIDQRDHLRVDFNYTVDFAPKLDSYPVSHPFYEGSYKFRKHLYEIIGGMNKEEVLCAQELDRLPQVKTWIRNLERKPQTSFWLPTSSDRFYPDFVAELTDGRLLVVEYKGQYISDTADTREKCIIGKLWEELSNGEGIFIMAVAKDNKGRGLKAQFSDMLK